MTEKKTDAIVQQVVKAGTTLAPTVKIQRPPMVTAKKEKSK